MSNFCIEIIKNFKSIFEKIISILLGSYYIFTIIINIPLFNCYWSDYCIMFYTGFIIFLIVLNSIKINLFFNNFKDLFGFIDCCGGKGFFFLLVSILFYNYNIKNINISTKILGLGGIVLIFLEFLCLFDRSNDKNNNEIVNIKNNEEFKN